MTLPLTLPIAADVPDVSRELTGGKGQGLLQLARLFGNAATPNGREEIVPRLCEPCDDGWNVNPVSNTAHRAVARNVSETIQPQSNFGPLVPEGLILTTQAFDEFLKHHALEAEFAAWSAGDGTAGPRLAAAFRSRPLPATLAECIRAAVASAWETQLLPLAVRSSATVEDSATSSQAGRFATVMPVKRWAEIEPAIREVWASLFNGCPRGPAKMAVVLQQVVPAVSSGVGFADAQRISLEAVNGLASLLVRGQATPDRWEFTGDGRELLETRLVSRALRIVLERSSELSVQVLPLREQFHPALNDAEAHTLAGLLARIATIYGAIDVEFCRDAAGRFWFVQLRPQTRPVPVSELNPLVTTATGDGLPLGGVTAAWGAASGRLLIVEPGNALQQEAGVLAEPYIRHGDILLTSTVNIGATHSLSRLAGMVAELGGTLSHTAILAREYGLPAVVGASGSLARALRFFEPQLQPLAPGVWSVAEVTLDASRQLLLPGCRPIRQQPLLETLAAVSPALQPTLPRLSEWPHYTDATGRDWTGKPEYPLCRLQLDLSLAAWQVARRMLGRHAEPLEVRVSTVTPTAEPQRRADGAWMIGAIEPGRTESQSPGQFRVVAFPTEQLCQLGDELLTASGELIPRVVRRYHRRRRAAFQRLEEVTVELARTTDPCRVDYRRVCETYTVAVAFAHTRATFRRRVAIPLQRQALRRVPDAVRPLVAALVTTWNEGLVTETTHVRDVALRELLFDLADRPDDPPPESAAFARKLKRFAVSFKFDRSSRDALDAPPPVQRVLDRLRELLRGHSPEPIRELRSRTVAGYRRQLRSLRPLIAEHDPAFDWQPFEDALTLAWETPALTDFERHAQHRFHHQFRRVLLRLEGELRNQGRLAATETLFEVSLDCFWKLVEESRRHEPATVD